MIQFMYIFLVLMGVHFLVKAIKRKKSLKLTNEVFNVVKTLVVTSIIYFYGLNLLVEYILIYGIISIVFITQVYYLAKELGYTSSNFGDKASEIGGRVKGFPIIISMIITVLSPFYMVVVLITEHSLILGELRTQSISYFDSTLLIVIYLISNLLRYLIDDTIKNFILNVNERTE